MNVYIEFTQTTGKGELFVNILNINSESIWYKHGQTCYTNLEDVADIEYNLRYHSHLLDTAVIVLNIYHLESDVLLYRIDLHSSTTSNSTIFTTLVTDINIGTAEIGTELTSTPILVTANFLKDEKIGISGMKDESFLFSGDNINWYSDSIPLNHIDWLTTTTFNLYINRKWNVDSKFYGKNITTIEFDNLGTSFPINVTSDFTVEEQRESGVWEKGSGDFATKQINDDYPNNATQDYSLAMGMNTTASGLASVTQGRNNIASNSYASASGLDNEASGIASSASGSYNIASASQSYVEGRNNISSGTASHAEGSDTISSGVGSHSEGDESKAYGDNSHAEGLNCIASATSCHAEGMNTVASGLGSHSEGAYTVASGDYSHSQGWYSVASGDYSFASGSGCTASGVYSFASGSESVASANYSFALGYSCDASGPYSFAIGSYVTSSGLGATAMGGNTTALGNMSTALGYNTEVNGYASISMGEHTKVSGNHSFVGGIHTEVSGHVSFNHSLGISPSIPSIVSGDYSSILGGSTHNISGDFSSIVGGRANNNGGDESSILGGETNTISTSTANCSVIGGKNNVVYTSAFDCGIFSSDGCVIRTGSDSSAMIGGRNSAMDAVRSAVIGGQNQVCSHDDMVSVPALKLFHPTAPTSPEEGMMYYNTTSKHFYGWNGTAWKQLDN